MDTIEKFKEKCRQSGLKITPQRVAVYQALASTQEHPSAESVYKMVRPILANISLDTVSRTLKTLTDMGVAFAVEGSGDVVRYDSDIDSHQHFRCVKCKRIVDFHYKQFDNIALPTDMLGNCKVIKATLYVEGVCDECLSKECKS